MTPSHIAAHEPQRNKKIEPACINCYGHINRLWAEIGRLRAENAALNAILAGERP